MQAKQLRGLVDRLAGLPAARRALEAEELRVLVNLARGYRVNEGELIAALAERMLPGGGKGTPSVSEFLAAEVAAALSISIGQAGDRIADALNLRYRHEALWEAVQELEIDARRACFAARACAELPIGIAGEVTRCWLPKQAKLGWTAAFNLLERMILEADPVLAAKKEQEALARRDVHVWRARQGVSALSGSLDVLDAHYFEAAVNQFADLLRPSNPGAERGVLRAKAVGILAHPAHALGLLQAQAQQPLPVSAPTPPTTAADALSARPERDDQPAGDGQGGSPRRGEGGPPEHPLVPVEDLAEPHEPEPPETLHWPSAREGSARAHARALLPVAEPPAPCGCGAPEVELRPAHGRGCPEAPMTPTASGVVAASNEPGESGRPDLMPTPLASRAPGTPPSSAAAIVADVGCGSTMPGHRCGTIQVPLRRLAPRVNLTVHVSLDAEGHLSPAARVERAEHLTLQSLAELLDGKQVRVQPVIDLNDAPQEDGYVPSERLRQAVGLAFEHEVFPYSNRSAAGCDLDHTVAYQGGRRGQTRLGNLAPLSRRIHRAKTAGVWKLRRPQPGVFEWTSPLGLHYRVTRHGTVRLA